MSLRTFFRRTNRRTKSNYVFVLACLAAGTVSLSASVAIFLFAGPGAAPFAAFVAAQLIASLLFVAALTALTASELFRGPPTRNLESGSNVSFSRV